jgi:hypothetical protein
MGRSITKLRHSFKKRKPHERRRNLMQALNFIFQNIFTTFTVTSSHETTLAGNQWLEDMKRLGWKSNSTRRNQQSQKKAVSENKAVTLVPMEIRTYVITVAKR